MLAHPLVRRLHLAGFLMGMVVWSISLLSPVPNEDAERMLGSRDGVFYFGKTLHVVAYLGLTLVAGMMYYARYAAHWWAFALCVHGGLIEILQPYFGRGGKWADWGLDSIGVVVGIILVRVWWQWGPTAWTGAKTTPARVV